MDQLIDITTLSQRLCVKPMTLYGWLHRGTIPFYKIGRLVRFSEKEVQAWLSKKKREGQPAKAVDIDLT